MCVIECRISSPESIVPLETCVLELPTCFGVNATPQAPVRKICFLGPAVSVIELMWDGAWCPQGLLPCGLPAPYLCVSCFPASASNGRSWFSSSAFSSEYFSTSQGQPSGKRDVHAASSDSCSVEHGFKINVILTSKCELWHMPTWSMERAKAGRTETWVNSQVLWGQEQAPEGWHWLCLAARQWQQRWPWSWLLRAWCLAPACVVSCLLQ